MNDLDLTELANIIDTHSNGEGVTKTEIEGISCFKMSSLNIRLPVFYRPSVYIIAQGKKQVILNNELYRYRASEFLLVSMDLPLTGQVTEASTKKPYLCAQIDIYPHHISRLALKLKREPNSLHKTERGLFVGKTNTNLLHSVLRLMRLLETPKDISFLAGGALEEVYYRLLTSEYGSSIINTALSGSNMHGVSKVIEHIKLDISRPFDITELASLANMSVSALYSHFKKATALSPLQYQKQLRLTKARQIILAGEVDATRAAYSVGYESPSQFNREYSRMFGEPPLRDKIKHLEDT